MCVSACIDDVEALKALLSHVPPETLLKKLLPAWRLSKILENLQALDPTWGPELVMQVIQGLSDKKLRFLSWRTGMLNLL